MKLTELFITPKAITNGIDVIRQMETLRTTGLTVYDPNLHFPSKEFWKKYDAGDFDKPHSQ